MNLRSAGYEPAEDSRLLYLAEDSLVSFQGVFKCLARLLSKRLKSVIKGIPLLPRWDKLVLRGIANPVSLTGFPGSNPGRGVLFYIREKRNVICSTSNC